MLTVVDQFTGEAGVRTPGYFDCSHKNRNDGKQTQLWPNAAGKTAECARMRPLIEALLNSRREVFLSVFRIAFA